MAEQTLTERQRKWATSMRSSLQQRTGKSLEQWVAIAKGCPETGRTARLKWFKDNHGLLQNSALYVLGEAFPSSGVGREPDALRAALWSEPASREIFEALQAAIRKLPDLVVGQRKGYSAWSREFQFASARPIKGGKARLGLAVEPSSSPRLVPARNEGWSERLKSSLVLHAPAEVDSEVETLLKQAWERS